MLKVIHFIFYLLRINMLTSLLLLEHFVYKSSGIYVFEVFQIYVYFFSGGYLCNICKIYLRYIFVYISTGIYFHVGAFVKCDYNVPFRY